MKIDWKNKELIINTVMASSTQTEILNKLGLGNGCGNNQTLLKYIKLYNIDISHLSGSEIRISKLRKLNAARAINDKNFFINGVWRVSHSTKKRLISGNLKEHKCAECGIGSEWNGKHLSLQLDHINGDSLDNRLENLRFLCPNCHSQTSTYAGKKLKIEKVKEQIFDFAIFEKERKAPKKEDIENFLNINGIEKSYKHFKMGQENFKLLCNYYKIDLLIFKDRTKIDCPAKEDLQKILLINTLVDIGKILGLSNNAVKKHAIKNNLFLPSSNEKGYWHKVYTRTIKQITFEDLILENGHYKLNPSFNVAAISVTK